MSERFGYNRNDIVVLTDDQQDPRGIPTKDSIVSTCAQSVLLPYIFSAVEGNAMVSGGRTTK
jgi:hypothetical protein